MIKTFLILASLLVDPSIAQLNATETIQSEDLNLGLSRPVDPPTVYEDSSTEYFAKEISYYKWEVGKKSTAIKMVFLSPSKTLIHLIKTDSTRLPLLVKRQEILSWPFGEPITLPLPSKIWIRPESGMRPTNLILAKSSHGLPNN